MKNVFSAVVAVALVLLAACTQDAYEKGEGEYSLLRADFVDMHAGSDKYVDYVVTDDGDSLAAEPPFTISWIQTADSTYRALLYYNKREGKAEVVSIGQVLVPAIKNAGTVKGGVVTDPVYVESVWRARTGRYLNLRLRVLTGQVEEEKKAGQVFGCADDTLVSHPDGHSALYLRLYHSQNGEPEYYSRYVFLSVPIGGVKADTIVMRINTYDGVVEKRFF